jgi:hypothetical protein
MVGRPTTATLPKYTRFTASVDDVTYSFYTLEAYTATDDGTGVYTFLTSTGSPSIPVVEGTLKTKTFYAGVALDRQVYIIPDLLLILLQQPLMFIFRLHLQVMSHMVNYMMLLHNCYIYSLST